MPPLSIRWHPRTQRTSAAPAATDDGTRAGVVSPTTTRAQPATNFVDLYRILIFHSQGFEFGSGFSGTCMRGSEHNDLFTASEDESAVPHSSGTSLGTRARPTYACVVGQVHPMNPLRTQRTHTTPNHPIPHLTSPHHTTPRPIPPHHTPLHSTPRLATPHHNTLSFSPSSLPSLTSPSSSLLLWVLRVKLCWGHPGGYLLRRRRLLSRCIQTCVEYWPGSAHSFIRRCRCASRS